MRQDDTNTDADAEAFLESRDPGEPDGHAVAKAAMHIIARFGQEAPLRAELVALDALATGDMASYRLFKLIEGAAESMLFMRPMARAEARG